jgi:hypothetical protein
MRNGALGRRVSIELLSSLPDVLQVPYQMGIWERVKAKRTRGGSSGGATRGAGPQWQITAVRLVNWSAPWMDSHAPLHYDPGSEQ